MRDINSDELQELYRGCRDYKNCGVFMRIVELEKNCGVGVAPVH